MSLDVFKKIFLLVLMFYPLLSIGEIYQWTDENGKKHFSDSPPEGETYRDISKRLQEKENNLNYHPSVKNQQTEIKNALKGSAENEEVSRSLVLQKGDPEKVEIYYVGFAPYAKERVFMRETLYAQKLFDKYWDTEGRSVSLINHDSKKSTHLMATKENLQFVLKAVGEKMDDNDILYLYLTSHGSKDHYLSVDYPPRDLSNINAKDIDMAISRAGIKWRLVVVSACYSGGFIADLKSTYSIVATAADAEHTSFGCDDSRDFTYYGQAIFKEQMAQGGGLLSSLDKARGVVARMEERQGQHSSNPQYVPGSKAERYIRDFEKARLSKRRKKNKDRGLSRTFKSGSR